MLQPVLFSVVNLRSRPANHSLWSVSDADASHPFSAVPIAARVARAFDTVTRGIGGPRTRQLIGRVSRSPQGWAAYDVWRGGGHPNLAVRNRSHANALDRLGSCSKAPVRRVVFHTWILYSFQPRITTRAFLKDYDKSFRL